MCDHHGEILSSVWPKTQKRSHFKSCKLVLGAFFSPSSLLSFCALISVRLSPSTSLRFSLAQNGLLQRADSRPSVGGRSCDVSISRQTAEWTSSCVSEPHQPSSTPPPPPPPPPTHLLCSPLSPPCLLSALSISAWLFFFISNLVIPTKFYFSIITTRF